MWSGCALLCLIIVNIVQPHRYGSAESLIYGICLFVCSFFSYLYTTRYTRLRASLLRKLDHAAIFLLIAGTYTPFAVAGINGPLGIRLLYWIWALAAGRHLPEACFARTV